MHPSAVLLFLLILIGVSSCDSRPAAHQTTATIEFPSQLVLKIEPVLLATAIRDSFPSEITMRLVATDQPNQFQLIVDHPGQLQSAISFESTLEKVSITLRGLISSRLDLVDSQIQSHQKRIGQAQENLRSNLFCRIFPEPPDKLGLPEKSMMSAARQQLKTLLIEKARLQENREATTEMNEQINILRAFVSDKAPAYQADAMRMLKDFFTQQAELEKLSSELSELLRQRRMLDGFRKSSNSLFKIRKLETQ